MTHRWLAVLFAIAIAGCAAPPPPRAVVVDPWPATSDRIDSLGGAGRPEAALDLARADLRAAIARGAPAWRLAEPRAHVVSFDRETALSPATRARLAEAALALRDAHAATDAESLASARERCTVAWRIRCDALGAGDVRTAEAALALAEAQLALGNPGAADSLGLAARTSFVTALGADHPRVADADELLGRVAKNYSGGQLAFAAARGRYEEALRIRLAAYGPCSLPVASTWQDLGNLYRSVQRWPEALQMFGTALELRRALAGPVDEDVASALGAIAYLHANAGHWAEGEAFARAAIAATPRGPDAPAGPRATRLGLHGQMLRRLGRYAESIAPLREAVALRESLWMLMPHDEGSTIVAGLSLHRDLAISLAAVGRGDEAFEQLARGSSRSLAGRLVGADPVHGAAWPELLPRVRRALGPDEAMITWARPAPWASPGDYPMWACVLRSSGPVRWVRLERRTPAMAHVGTIREALWGELIFAAGWPRQVTDTVAVGRMAREMGSEWFEPLEPALAGVRRIVVCAPELFANGPLGALQDAQGRWLGQRFTISYVPSAALFVHARERPARGRRSGPVLLVGDPAYGGSDADRWPRLPGAGREMRSLVARFPAATVLTGPDASAARVRALAASGALGRYRLIHFAAHTAIDPARVLDAALVLAPNTPGGRSSSRLLAREVAAGWTLDADLVCLAACRSLRGAGSASDGDLGLQEAFLAAGARALLVTLWPVDDRATELLMEDFYARLTDPAKPAGRGDALRGAQETLRLWRDADGSRPYAHPAYWAAFALVGDPD
jgi:tetratricopeptide (TPR) repeat protein